MECHNVAMGRCKFLNEAKNISDWSNAIFTDETWSNANHTVSKNWSDDTHKGFVPDALLTFKSKWTVDYHEEMNAEI